MGKHKVKPENDEIATFAAGCFWGVEDKFSRLPGVISTRVGYIGGHTEKPTYHEVCSGRTGHAEAVQLHFDKTKTSYPQLVSFFWEMHDPTQLNRQGPDVGAQYRSAIFYHSQEQKDQAEESKKSMEGLLGAKIATSFEEAKVFTDAEEYHQKYNEKHRGRW